MSFAGRVNDRPGVNVYFAPSLRRDDVLSRRVDERGNHKRGRKEDVLGSPIVWADFDSPGSPAAGTRIYNAKAAAPHLVVITGTEPEVRAQAFWFLDELVTDQGQLDEMLAGLHVGLEFVADPKVVNADRVMRLPGCISWPKPGKEGRIAEPTTLHTPKSAPAGPYSIAGFVATFPRKAPVPARKGEDVDPGADLLSLAPAVTPVAAATPAHPVYAAVTPSAPRAAPGTPERTHDILGRVIDGRDEHAMRIMGGALRNLAATLGRWPTADELIAEAWPTYERTTAPKHPRPGEESSAGLEREARGITWFREKAGVQIRRATSGAIVGLETVEKCVAAAGAHAATGVQALPQGPLFTPASTLAGKPIAPRSWLVRDLVPDRTVTLLGGDGGTGKSLLALQLAVSTATRGAWLHRPIEKPGRALFLTAEDDLDEVHRRLADICTAEGFGLADLDGLLIRSLAGEDALLAVLDRGSGMLVKTPLYEALDRAIGEARPTAVFLDTLADLHSGEENNRAHARQFIGLLRALAIRHGCAVVLLAHPSLSGMASGSGLSGSTAWNGSVRSRLYLDRVKEEGYEPDPDARKLTTKKANYGPTGDEIALRWQNGVFVAEAAPTGLDRMAAGAKAERVFLALLRQFTAEGRSVNHAGGRYYAPKVFAEHPQSEGVTKRAFGAAMSTLLAGGKIGVEKYGPPSKGATRIAEVT